MEEDTHARKNWPRERKGELGRQMTRVIAGMTRSLDGFVPDSSGSVGPLYPDFAELEDSSYMNSLIAETGAVLMGRRSFEMGDPDWYVGNYEFQVPIFVLTHPPAVAPKQDERLTFTFVTDGVESAVKEAKAAAGARAVTVIGGASATQQLLGAGLVDELQVDIMPVLLGAGLRLFENGGLDSLALEKLDVQEIGARTSL
jgi:dihydrofolate reductase